MLLAHAAEAHFFSMEHTHVLLNHLPVTGLAMAILALALALKHHSRKTEIIALILVFVASASAWPVVSTGQRAYRTVRAITDDRGTAWLDEHMERGEKAAPAFYTLAVLSLAALVAPHKWPRSTRPLAFATLALAVLCLGASSWISLAGGQVRHPEFRNETAPAEHHEPHTH
jgi:disulfide bond formation protein DsbB